MVGREGAAGTVFCQSQPDKITWRKALGRLGPLFTLYSEQAGKDADELTGNQIWIFPGGQHPEEHRNPGGDGTWQG